MRVIRFCGDGFSAIRMGAFDASDTPIARVGLGEKSGDLGDGFGRGAVAEFNVLPVLWVSGPQWLPLGGLAPLSGSVNRYSLESETVQPGRALNWPVNIRGAVNRESGEFAGLTEANGQNSDGSARPGRRRFQPQNRAGTQIVANVWDNALAQTARESAIEGG